MSKKIFLVPLGCPKNQVDTEVMLGQVQAAGHALCDAPEDADVIVVNTCAFIDAAKEESVDTILEMAQYKETGRCKQLVVTGCLTQRHPEEVAREIPEIDHILGSSEFSSIVQVIEGKASNAEALQAAGEAWNAESMVWNLANPPETSRPSARASKAELPNVGCASSGRCAE